MISDEALEAAKEAWRNLHAQPGSWDLERSLREALEAAAPYLKAEAWDECYTRLPAGQSWTE